MTFQRNVLAASLALIIKRTHSFRNTAVRHIP